MKLNSDEETEGRDMVDHVTRFALLMFFIITIGCNSQLTNTWLVTEVRHGGSVEIVLPNGQSQLHTTKFLKCSRESQEILILFHDGDSPGGLERNDLFVFTRPLSGIKREGEYYCPLSDDIKLMNK